MLLLKHDYPQLWKTPFSFLLEKARGPHEAGAFSALLVSVLALLDDEVVRIHADKRDEQAMKIKDAIREECSEALAYFLS